MNQNSYNPAPRQHARQRNQLLERVARLNWAQLADRTAPLPEGVSLEWLLSDFAQLRIGQHFNRYGWPDEG